MPDVRIAQIESMIAAREGKPGYKLNVATLKAELARLTELRDATTAESGALTPRSELP